MLRYIARRLLLIFPTLIGIITINFFIVQLAPGGPVDQMIANLTGQNVEATARIAGAVDAQPQLDMAESGRTPVRRRAGSRPGTDRRHREAVRVRPADP